MRENYWNEIEALAQDLPAPWVVVKSIENRRTGVVGGRITEAAPIDAAKLIVDGTHELASDDAVAAWRADREEKRQRATAEAAARRLQAEVLERNLLNLSRPVPPVAEPATEPPPADDKKAKK